MTASQPPETHEGPVLEKLTRRLAETPPDFLSEPRIGRAGMVNVAAVVSDLVAALGGQPLSAAAAQPFLGMDAKKDRNGLALVLVACWLLYEDWFQQQVTFSAAAYDFLLNGLQPLAALVNAPEFVTDPDHREELARLALKALKLRPAGENDTQATDRLTTLDSVERQRVLSASREAEERTRAVLEAMAAKAAQDAAAKWSRE